MAAFSMLCRSAIVLGLAFLTVPANAGESDSMTDKDVYSAVIEQSANTCKDYTGDKAEPDIRNIPVGVIRSAYDRHVLICPNAKLGDKKIGVVWYGNHKAIAWDPTASGAADTMNKELAAMAGKDTYPSGIQSWAADGTEMKGQMIPMFEVDCASSTLKDCLSR